MFISRWDRWPFFDMDKTLEEMDRVFGTLGRPLGLRSVPRGTFPAMNLYDQDGALVLTAEIPGVDPEQLELTVLNDSITLKGQRKEPELPEGTRCYRKERITGEFVRTVSLPDSVDPDQVKADYKNGVLTVRLTKAVEARAKKIKIQA